MRAHARLARGTGAPETATNATPVCPRCRAALVGRLISGLHLESCPSCGGVWASAVVLTQIVVERSAGHARAIAATCPTGAPALSFAGAIFARCPQCGVGMQRQLLGKQNVLVCRRHGVWFDRGALAIATRAAADGLLEHRGELERSAFRDDMLNKRYPALLAHARAIGGRLPSRGPIAVLAELFA